MLIHLLITLIIVGNLIYAYQCIFQTRKYIEKYGFPCLENTLIGVDQISRHGNTLRNMGLVKVAQ